MENNNQNNNKEQKVSWNLAEALIQELGDLLKEASKNYIRNDFDKSFGILKAIRMRVVDRLKDEELEMFIGMENQMYLLSKQKKAKGDFGVQSRENLESSYRFWRMLDDYNNKLLRTMRKYGYLMESKGDRTKLKI